MKRPLHITLTKPIKGIRRVSKSGNFYYTNYQRKSTKKGIQRADTRLTVFIIQQLRVEGYTFQAIANVLNVSRQRVFQLYLRG